MLRHNGLPFGKAEFGSAHGNSLLLPAYQVHLNPAGLLVVESVVLELREVEPGLQLAVDASQQVQVELGGDALRVIVSPVEHLPILLQIDSNQQTGLRTAKPANSPEKDRSFLGLKVAYG